MSVKKMCCILLSGGVLASPILSYADDTEIYFNSKQEKVKPNVLFILDRSGSMDSDPQGMAIVNNQAQDIKTLSKLNLLKESFQLIFNKDEMGGYRVGIMDYASGYPNLTQEIVDIDEIDPSRNIDKLSPVYNGDKVSWSQPVWVNTDDGYQNGLAQNNWLDLLAADLEAAYINLNNASYLAYRFDNILLKPAAESGKGAPDYGVESAKLDVFIYTPYLSSAFYKKQIEIYIDPNLDSQYLRQRTNSDFSSRYNAAKAAGTTYKVMCVIPEAYLYGRYQCDVTDLVRQQIARDGWKDGNAITFILRNASTYTGDPNWIPYIGYLRFKDYFNGTDQAYLKLTASKDAVAENKRTKKETLVDKAFSIVALGATETNYALLMAAQYVSNIPHDYTYVAKGPYHSDGYAKFLSNNQVVYYNQGVKSPLLSGCQLTHFILMSDGQPTASHDAYLKYYMGETSYYCQVDGANEKVGVWTENCGRQLVHWLSKTDNSNFTGPNYIRTHTIGFGMVDDDADPEMGDVQFGPNSAPVVYLRDLASYGGGQFHTTTNIEGLVDAFRSIINEALSISTTAVSGQVLSSASNSFKQRKEVFYTFYQSGLKDYWPGNLKGFKMKYEKVDINGMTDVEIPVLYSWSDASTQAIDALGKFKAVDSAWSEGMGDGANVEAGGVVNQMADEADLPNRNLFTSLDGIDTAISSSSTNITAVDLGLTNSNDAKKKGLLDFMRGYVYEEGGAASLSGASRIKKQGDSIASGVTLVSYGCDAANVGMLDCDYDRLNLVGLLASNDGVFRTYNLTTGKALYEFMPKEMLPIISKLQDPATLDETYLDKQNNLVAKTQVKTYGLDSNVILYHEDSNGDGYINNGEKAYAYVTAGRGGAYIYAFDISKKDNVVLMWTKTDKTQDMQSPVLGETWSEPVVGKVKINGADVPVIVFGAGYDPQQNNNTKGLVYDNVGNGVYMLNAVTGEVIWSSGKLPYSVPGGVTAYTVTEGEKTYLSDLFFGDMGGQLWRFHINNGSSVNGLVKAVGNNEGVIAKISGNNEKTHRRFYQKPFIYDLTNEGLEGMLSITIGTGYKAHPLVTGNEDRFYSFRVPVDVSATYDQPLTETDLTELKVIGNDLVSDGKEIDKGFMIVLESGVGEKVISNAYALGGKVVFSTYIPDNTFDPTTCIPNSGKQRSYSIDLMTGKSLFKTPYVETSISSIPSDTAVYCGERYCSLVTGVDMLNGDKSKYEGKCTDGDCIPPATVDMGNPRYVKAGWTDIFSL